MDDKSEIKVESNLLQRLFDNRVKALFQNLLTCPAEVDNIKKDYM